MVCLAGHPAMPEAGHSWSLILSSGHGVAVGSTEVVGLLSPAVRLGAHRASR